MIFHPITREVASVHLKQFYRKPVVLFWAIGFPILMVVILGLAFSYKTESLKRVAVICEANCNDNFLKSKIEKIETWIQSNSNKMQNELVNFEFSFVSEKEADMLLRQGKINIIILYDPVQEIIKYRFNTKEEEAQKEYILLKRYFNLPTIYSSPTNEKIENVSTAGSRYIDFLLPGLMAVAISTSCLWGMAWYFIEMRSKKIMKRIYLTNINKWHFINGHLIARILITLAEVFILYIIAKVLFQIKITGSVFALFIVFFSGMFCFTGIALLAGSRTDNIKVGEGMVDALTVPFMLFSGIFFSYHVFPEFLIPIIQYLPLTLIVDAFRSIFNEGAGILEVMPASIILSVLGFIFSSLALRIYKWY